MNKITAGNKTEQLGSCCEWIKTKWNGGDKYKAVTIDLDKDVLEAPLFHQWLDFCTREIHLPIGFSEKDRRLTFETKDYKTIYHLYLSLVIMRFALEKKSYAEAVLKLYGTEVFDPIRALVYSWLMTKQSDHVRGLFQSAHAQHFPNKIIDYWDFKRQMEEVNGSFVVNGFFGTDGNSGISSNERKEYQEAINEIQKIVTPTLKQIKDILVKYNIS